MRLERPIWTASSHLVAAGLVLVGGCALTGCSDPKFQSDQAIRNDRIYYYSQLHDRRKTDETAHLQSLDDEVKSRGIRHDAHLKDRLTEVKRMEQTRAEDLRETRPARHERLHSIYRGKPENMRETWADMFY